MQRYMAMLVFVILFTATIDSGAASGDENWPQWRGPDGTGVAAAGEYPMTFSKSKNVKWKVELPGRGSSTPAVWGESIFVTCAIDGEDGVICYGFDGKEKWRQKLGKEKAGKHRNASGSNASPVVNGQNLVVYYKSGTVACLTHAGEVLWTKNLIKEYGKDTLYWDRGTSPVLAAGNVVIAVMQEGGSYLVSLDLASGDVVWKSEREYNVNKESNHAYTTPAVVDLDGREAIVVWGADHLDAWDAEKGEKLWQANDFNPKNEKHWRAIASAAVDSEVAIVPYGRGNFVRAMKLADATGDVTESHKLWEKSDLGSDVPTPILHGDQVIVLADRGSVFCFDKLTGEEKWQVKLPKGRAKYFASPVMAGDTIYLTREDGVIMVGKETEGTLKVYAENDMGEATIATPVPIRNHLLVRGLKHLFMIGK
ncbi:PQQ-binding-like beta-propeller repeat protein [Mariniblastus sp.]|nr:PQQ-binding-like beta-propeller repeat protein [Mariniblastus sp.]